MAASTDLFERRNRARIVAVVLIAAVNYVIAVALAAVAVALSLAVLAIFKFEIWPDSVEMLELMGYGIGGICAVAFVIGFFTALVRIPSRRREPRTAGARRDGRDGDRRRLAPGGSQPARGSGDRRRDPAAALRRDRRPGAELVRGRHEAEARDRGRHHRSRASC